MLKLVKLEKKYRSQLIDMMEEWEKTGEKIVPFEILQAYPKSINATSILIEDIGHMGKKSGLEEIPKAIELIEENEKV